MPKRRSRSRKKSVKKSRKRSDNRGKIRNPKTGRYVKKSGVIGKKLLEKSRKKKSRNRRVKSKKKRRSRRIGRTRGQALAGPAAARVGGNRAPGIAGIDTVIPNIKSIVEYCKDGTNDNDVFCEELSEHYFYSGDNPEYRVPTNEKDFETWWNNQDEEAKKEFIRQLLIRGIDR